jgi:hypothetical protein
MKDCICTSLCVLSVRSRVWSDTLNLRKRDFGVLQRTRLEYCSKNKELITKRNWQKAQLES